MSNIIQTEQTIYTYMYDNHFLKEVIHLKEQGGVYESVCRKEREGENDVIILQTKI